MFDLDKWKEIWATLRSNRLRTFLTAFGVFWGILMLMAMLGFGSAIQSGSQRQMKGMATNLLFCWGQQTTEAFDGLPPGRGVRFNTDDIEILRRLPGVEHLAPRLQLGGWMNNFTVQHESKSGTFTVMARLPGARAHHRVRVRRRPLHQRARHRREPQGRRDRQGRRASSCSRPTRIRSASTSRSAASTSRSSASRARCARGQAGDRDANTLFVPFTTLKTAFNMGNRVGFFAMTAKPGTDGPELERQVREALSRHHRISPTDRARDRLVQHVRDVRQDRRRSSRAVVLSLDRRRPDAARRRRRRVEHHADHRQGAHEGDRRAQGARRERRSRSSRW